MVIEKEVSESTEIRERRIRQCGPKSRTGCRTCKIRHTKCDETKPTCKRCRSARWICDGYDDTPRHGSAAAKMLVKSEPVKNPFLDFPGTSKEHRSFHFFFNGMERRPNIFEDEFWGSHLQTIAASQKPIQHAIVAVAALIEDLLDGHDIQNAKSRNFSLIQYNKAINNLTSYNGDRESRQVTLLTCLLFLYLETLSDMRRNMWAHFKSGIDMMESYKRDFINPARRPLGLSDLDLDTKEQDLSYNEIHRAFWKSSVCLFVCWPAPHRFVGHTRDIKPIQPVDESFSSLTQIETRLNQLVIETLRPDKTPTSNVTGHGLLTEQGIHRKLSLILKLKKWTSGLGVFIVDNMATAQTEWQRVQLLRMQSILASIWNSVTLWDSEAAFDQHTAEFRTMLSLCQQYIVAQEARRRNSNPDLTQTSEPSTNNATTVSATSPTCSIPTESSPHLPQPILDEMPLLCILHFIAMKCRSPSIRRQATHLLSVTQPQFSSPWHAPTSRRIAQCVISFEESSCVKPVTEDPATWPKEECRIHATYRVPLGLMIKTDRPINFVWRPGGKGTGWVTFRADIPPEEEEEAMNQRITRLEC